MKELGLDPETALKLILMLLRGAVYFFSGFAVLGSSTYVVLVCLGIFDSEARPKARIAKLAQPIGCASGADENHDLTAAQVPTLFEEAAVVGERCCTTESKLALTEPSALSTIEH